MFVDWARFAAVNGSPVTVACDLPLVRALAKRLSLETKPTPVCKETELGNETNTRLQRDWAWKRKQHPLAKRLSLETKPTPACKETELGNETNTRLQRDWAWKQNQHPHAMVEGFALCGDWGTWLKSTTNAQVLWESRRAVKHHQYPHRKIIMPWRDGLSS